jgi:formylglycine-generating enzyme required for sulfatase activity
MKFLIPVLVLVAAHACGQMPQEGTAPGTRRINPKDGLPYVWVPPTGPQGYRMGCSEGDHECEGERETPHQVVLTKGFWMGQTEVTQEAYEKVTRRNPSKQKGPKLPVESVDWESASGYCQQIGMRLPTEAEWEWAARGGTKGARYGELDRIAWHSLNSDATLKPVGLLEPNAYGLYDMLGNVYEFVSDWYEDRLPSESVVDPQGPPKGRWHTIRGGSWINKLTVRTRASYRLSREPVVRADLIGFRCAGSTIAR